MRICYFSGDCQGIYDLRILKKILEARHEVYYIFFRKEEINQEIANLPGLKIVRFFPQIILKKSFKTGSQPAGIKSMPFIRFIISVLKTIRNDLLYYFNYVKKFKQIISVIKPDIVVACYIQSCGLITALSAIKPFLLVVWGSDILINPHESLYEKIKTKFVVNKADFIVCDSQYHKDEIVKVAGYLAKKITAFPWGINQQMFNPTKGDQQIRRKLNWQNNKVLIMNRWFEPVYGVEYFIEALPEVIKKIPETRVILIGEGSLGQKIRNMVNDYNLKDFVWFAGRIPHEKMANYLCVSDLYVSSSLSDGSSSCLMEALSCGIPAVVSDVSVYYEWIKDGYNGYVVPRKNPTAISRAIVSILQNPNINQMKANSLAIAKEKADWDKNYQKMEEVFNLLK